jgi:uncharacterized iron-regulated membrane protein
MDNSLQIRPTSGSKEKKRTIWFHLHFWIGWIAAVPIALVCLTGGILVFEGAIFQWEHKELYQLKETGTPLTVQQVLETYRSADPPLRVNHLGIPKSSNHSFSAYYTEIRPEGNRGARVFLNPYTGELTKLSAGFSISHLLIDVHRHMAGGRTGQQVVAISSLVLAITGIIGLVLWWPFRGRTFVRAWKRGQALDWHNALGLVVLVPLIIMAITGVTFTWGRHIWPLLENLQGYPSQPETPAITINEGNERVSMDLVVEQIRAEIPGKRITGIQPGNGKNAIKVFLDADGNNLQLFMDPYTGEELMRSDGAMKGPVGWYRKTFGRFHTMGPYHLFVRILWGILSIGGTVLVVTGLWVSVKRWRRVNGRTA